MEWPHSRTLVWVVGNTAGLLIDTTEKQSSTAPITREKDNVMHVSDVALYRVAMETNKNCGADPRTFA